MTQQKHPFYTEEHEAYRQSLRNFVAREIEPHAAEWDEAGTFPRELYQKAADIGLIPMGFPEEFGGVESDLFFTIIGAQELARAGVGGLSASLMSHMIGAPPIARAARPEIKQRVLPEILSGRKISALAITEPGGGSDVASLKTTARRDGDHYVVNGSKTFITSGMRADYYTVAVRTGGSGSRGVSLLLIERDRPGFERTALDRKMGWWCSDTATLYFDDCRVPAENLLGEENQGFRLIMQNFNFERLFMAAGCTAFAQVCLDEVVAYARERQTFGVPLIQHQVIRHKFADMTMHINATQAYLEQLAWRVENGENPVADVSLLKNQATRTMEFCAREAVQILGGAGFIRGSKSERIYREVRVNAIGGGAEEIMRDLAARQLGL
ncbi:MAG: acyl-CoA dehydrogenase family protein [Ectothiorhodospiraceae bacterium]|nr:acyl-CoA dehydrogenase family protein [Ectothiorhodospiraceae bacterium]